MSKNKNNRSAGKVGRAIKKTLLGVLAVILLIIILAGAGLGYLTIKEYNPDPSEEAEILQTNASETLSEGDSLNILTWNIGYAGLGKDSDFFMDGGKGVQCADEATCAAYLDGIASTIADADADITFIQEVDKNSKRSYGVDQRLALSSGDTVFAYNFNTPYVPYPIPTIGHVESGVMIDSDYALKDSTREALPVSYSWPIRLANLKRCLLVSRIELENSDNELVLINFHLEAYSDDQSRLNQAEQLSAWMASEFEKGNYVIVGGDFNMMFPDTEKVYPIHVEDWVPGIMTPDLFPDGFTIACDSSYPTCRLLNQPYDPTDEENTQFYVIDGFIVSPNVTLNTIETLHEDFRNSDHNPVLMNVTLNPRN